MAHISGLVAAKQIPSPFDYSDVVTTTTHKSLRGPRGAMIFYRKVDKEGNKTELDQKIDFAVFPGLQGGPHNHTISALSVALLEAMSPEFTEYQQRIISNSMHLAKSLQSKGFKIVSGGTDNHMMVVNLKGIVDGARVESVLQACNISVNKNLIPGEQNAVVPSGIRLGTPAMTTRGFGLEEFERVAEYFERGVKISQRIQKGKMKLQEFKERVNEGDEEIHKLKEEVIGFVDRYPHPADVQ